MSSLNTPRALAILTVLVTGASFLWSPPRKCKSFPGDSTWPSVQVWNQLNESVDGRLIHSVPVASPCHHPNYDEEKCNEVKAKWHSPEFLEQHSSSIQTPLFANKSCDPFTGPDSPCVIGKHIEYAVDVATPQHVISALKFAKDHNIRFVVRNTGHDYMGKSTGSRALAVWMGHLRETQWFDEFKGSKYQGPAVKVQAGVSVLQMYEEASARGLIVISGACPTVGFAGGYIQGGGHGPFGSIYGLGADQTLEMEVITTTGRLVKASPTENADLFWAISGGGGGTYAILWTLTVKAFPDIPIAGALISFSTSKTLSLNKWWEAVNFYQASTPTYTSSGATSFAFYSAGKFNLAPLFLPNGTSSSVKQLTLPFITKLKELNIEYTASYPEYPGFLKAYEGMFPSHLFGVGMFYFGNRLLGRGLWEDEGRFGEMVGVIREIVDDGAGAFDIAIRADLGRAGRDGGGKGGEGEWAGNAVLPAWRDAERTFGPQLLWDDHDDWETIQKKLDKITFVYGEALRKLTPGGGAYLNEADPFEPNWKSAFYGSNYDKLLSIKDKWDPEQVLYGATAVGGDRWYETSEGRLCPVGGGGLGVEGVLWKVGEVGRGLLWF